ncbi:hypothetical protein VTO73DRAFT_4188 [Trametes versicolor]
MHITRPTYRDIIEQPSTYTVYSSTCLHSALQSVTYATCITQPAAIASTRTAYSPSEGVRTETLTSITIFPSPLPMLTCGRNVHSPLAMCVE